MAVETGSGRPLILLHGFMGMGSDWLDHGPGDTLAETGFRLVLPDFRGHGQSPRPHDLPDVLADDALALRRALTALADGIALPPGSAGAQIAHWAAELGADPRALLCVMGSLVPTPEDDLRRITTPTLVVIGDRDERSDADELAALLPAGRFARVPGGHGGAFAAPELAAVIKAFLAGPADQPSTPPPPAHS
jgi:pimeloyl-ACP methyl ester carboxylesterase